MVTRSLDEVSRRSDEYEKEAKEPCHSRRTTTYHQSGHAYLAHIPQQIRWNSQKRGVLATPVISAYSFQECSVCHYTDRSNRPNQQTFCCQVCGCQAHADHNAALNLSRRVGDTQLRACPDRTAIKAVLMQRHEVWKQHQALEYHDAVKRKQRVKSSASPSSI